MKNAQRQMSADHERQAHDQSLNTFRRTCSPCTSEESRFEPGISEVWRSPATPANPAYDRSSRTATRLAARRPPQPRRPRARSRPLNVGASTCATGEGSEEHTSELQSLMRITYAVICLKKK